MDYSESIAKKIDTAHFSRLIDDFGIWQHTDGKKIDKQHGYALDDAARGLIVAIQYDLHREAQTCFDFLRIATGNGRIINFFSKEKKPLPNPWSEDALGETFWALSFAFSQKFNKDLSAKILIKIRPYVEKMTSTRGRAYSLIGACFFDKNLAKELANSLITDYIRNSRSNWHWIEDSVSYGNAIIPYSLFLSGAFLTNGKYIMIAGEMLDFLNKTSKHHKFPIVIGNQGWFRKGQMKAIFDQQPIDAAYQVLANVQAYVVLGDKKYLREAKKYFSWFWGNNLLRKPLIDIGDGSCIDGIQRDKLSNNRGAESIVCYLMAQSAIESLTKLK